ncbi:MAG: arylsulfatase A-like enzyme [Myxococcota bacterium]
MNRQMLVPVGVLVVVVALIGLLVVLGQQEQSAGKSETLAPTVGAKAKAPRGKAKGPTKVDPAKLLHVADPLAARGDAPEGAPNLVLIVVDALRRDQMSMYGGMESTTPFLSRLAAAGVVFDDTIASGPWSRPALVSLATGQHPATVGMIQPNDEGNQRVLADGVTTLAERLQQAGWYTAGVTANFNNNHKYGLAQGFDAWRDSHPSSFNPRVRLAAEDAVDELFQLLDKRPADAKERPVFAQLSWVDLHKPFVVTKEEAEPFEQEADNIAPYRAMVKRTDDAVEKLVSGLESRGLTPKNTVVAFVAAHGEGLAMPGHHGKQHGRTLYRSAVQVPWVVAGPGVKAGHRVGGMSHHTDVMPTLLGLVGVGVGEERLAGLDLAPLARGEGDAVERDAVYTDTWYFTANHAAIYTSDRVCQRDFGSTGGQPIPTGCYDRAADPDANRIADSDGDPLFAELEAWRTARGAEYDAWPHTTDAP